MNNAQTLIEDLDTAQRARMKADDFDRSYNHAHDAAWVTKCKRRNCLMRLIPDLAEEIELDRYRIMEEGHRQEVLMREELQAAGTILWHPGRLEWEEYEAKVEPDDVITEQRGKPCKIVLDYKSSDPYIFRKAQRYKDFNDLLSSEFFWMGHYPSQMLMYGAKLGIQELLILFKDKSRGTKHAVEAVADDYKNYLFEILAGLKEVNALVAKNQAPKAVMTEHCTKCEFMSTYCFPDDDGTALADRTPRISDADMETKIKRYTEIKPFEKEAKSLWSEIKDFGDGSSVIIGNYLLKRAEILTTKDGTPKEIKEQYKVPNSYFRTTLKDLNRPL